VTVSLSRNLLLVMSKFGSCVYYHDWVSCSGDSNSISWPPYPECFWNQSNPEGTRATNAWTEQRSKCVELCLHSAMYVFGVVHVDRSKCTWTLLAQFIVFNMKSAIKVLVKYWSLLNELKHIPAWHTHTVISQVSLYICKQDWWPCVYQCINM
jgi:hypothetical protein